MDCVNPDINLYLVQKILDNEVPRPEIEPGTYRTLSTRAGRK